MFVAKAGIHIHIFS